MFGMEEKGKKKKGAIADWEFDLEKQLQDSQEAKKIKTQTDQRVQQLKNLLREGGDKETFDSAQTLLHGFLAAQKVLQRLTQRK